MRYVLLVCLAIGAAGCRQGSVTTGDWPDGSTPAKTDVLTPIGDSGSCDPQACAAGCPVVGQGYCSNGKCVCHDIVWDDAGSPPADSGSPNSCTGVTCSGHGNCVNTGGPVCRCDQGYRAEGLDCVPGAVDPCDGVTCSGHGTCDAAGGPACRCEQGYHASGLSCEADQSCDGVTCSGHGACRLDGGVAKCDCDQGYHAEGLNCASDSGTPCDGVACSGHGACQVRPFIGIAECVCDGGYTPYGLSCIEEGTWGCRGEDGFLHPRGSTRCGADDSIIEVCRDENGDGYLEWAFGVNCNAGTSCSTGCLYAPCNVQPCPIETTCVASAHEQPLNVCVVTCDCSNCGNCDIEDFAASGAWQLQCGADSGQATVRCNKPCPSPGDGCIPYNPPLCWGMEGCMSGGY